MAADCAYGSLVAPALAAHFATSGLAPCRHGFGDFLAQIEIAADTFAVLREASVLESAFTDELMKMARFRNRLVHLYWDVDPEELHAILQSRLGDFDAFLSAIGKHIQL